MADPKPEVTTEPQPSLTPEPVAEPIKLNENTVPQSRLNEVIAERNTSRLELEKLQIAQKKAEEEELTKQGEFKELATQRETELGVLNSELEAFRQENKIRWEAVKANIPEDKIKHFAEGDSNESVRDNLRKFDEYVDLGVFDKLIIPGVDGRAPIKTEAPEGDFGGYKTRVEFVEKDPDGYRKWKKLQETTLNKNIGTHTIISEMN